MRVLDVCSEEDVGEQSSSKVHKGLTVDGAYAEEQWDFSERAARELLLWNPARGWF